jgi:hypothetical protein
LIKAGAYKNKSGDKQCFYELGNSLGKTAAGKLEAFFPKLNALSTQLPPLAFSLQKLFYSTELKHKKSPTLKLKF